jgi:Cys-rich protein (TIGR01571 family)
MDVNYLNLTPTNTFNPLYSCLDNLCACSMGLFFPYCLFGRIYERAEFGSCWVGCFKLFSIQFLINVFFAIIISALEWDMFLKRSLEFTDKIQVCNNNATCLNNIEGFDYNNLYDNNCEITNTTEICECTKQNLMDQCNFNNEMPEILNNFYLYTTILWINNIIVLQCFTGLLLGHYRTKLSHKYNILYNSRYNFLLHCFPLTNQCALCQEYNTIEMIEVLRPFTPVDSKLRFI